MLKSISLCSALPQTANPIHLFSLTLHNPTYANKGNTVHKKSFWKLLNPSILFQPEGFIPIHPHLITFSKAQSRNNAAN